MQQPFLHFEELRNLPCPRLDRTRGYLAPVGRLEMARRARVVIEEGEPDNEAALFVDHHVTAIANPADEMQQARLELLATRPQRRVVRRCLWVGSGLALAARRVRRLTAV